MKLQQPNIRRLCTQTTQNWLFYICLIFLSCSQHGFTNFELLLHWYESWNFLIFLDKSVCLILFSSKQTRLRLFFHNGLKNGSTKILASNQCKSSKYWWEVWILGRGRKKPNVLSSVKPSKISRASLTSQTNWNFEKLIRTLTLCGSYDLLFAHM